MFYVGADACKADWFAVTLAAAVTASAERRGLSSLPKAAEFDSHGLYMAMVYHSPKS